MQSKWWICDEFNGFPLEFASLLEEGALEALQHDVMPIVSTAVLQVPPFFFFFFFLFHWPAAR